MLENSVYSILSPEGFAAILWKNGKRAAEAAEVMKLTAGELKELGVIDKVLEEDADCSQKEKMRAEIIDFLERYDKKTGEEIREERYQKFRSM